MIYTKFPIQSQKQLSKDHVFGLSKIHLLEKLICLIMKNGQKYKAYKILYKTLNIMKNKIAQSQNRFPGLGPLSTCDASSIFSNFLTERAVVNVNKSVSAAQPHSKAGTRGCAGRRSAAKGLYM